jgi:hypothetical protein
MLILQQDVGIHIMFSIHIQDSADRTPQKGQYSINRYKRKILCIFKMSKVDNIYFSRFGINSSRAISRPTFLSQPIYSRDISSSVISSLDISSQDPGKICIEKKCPKNKFSMKKCPEKKCLGKE